MTWQIHHGFEVWVPKKRPRCRVPECSEPRHARGLCVRHYGIAFDQSRNPHDRDYVLRFVTESVNTEHWWCACPAPRHDNNECPICHLVSFSQDQIDQFNPNRETAS